MSASDLAIYLVSHSAPLKEAMEKISHNHIGMVMVADAQGMIVSVATDGDIRKYLLKHPSLEECITAVANANFVWADEKTPREIILKQLDHHIRAIPLLSADKKLVGVVSRDHFPVPEEESTYARARAPVRISFGGGGSDLTQFFAGENGAVINSTISLYSHATLRMRDDKRIFIDSRDLNAVLEAESLQAALGTQKKEFGLVLALLKTLHPMFGFELYLHSDFPVHSGLGGSAAIAAAVLGCFNQFRRDRWDLHELAELAFQAERLYLGIAGGWQDQYATIFGGFNFMEFRMEQNIVHPLRLQHDILLELEESLVLCDTGTSHHSGEVHKNQYAQMQSDKIRNVVCSHVELTYEIRNHLLRGRLHEFGECMHKAWQFKRQFGETISNPHLDAIYEGALANGAIGGKLLGAGGGGFFLFYVPPFQKHKLMHYLSEQKLKISPFRFEEQGLQVWSSRERRNA